MVFTEISNLRQGNAKHGTLATLFKKNFDQPLALD